MKTLPIRTLIIIVGAVMIISNIVLNIFLPAYNRYATVAIFIFILFITLWLIDKFLLKEVDIIDLITKGEYAGISTAIVLYALLDAVSRILTAA